MAAIVLLLFWRADGGTLKEVLTANPFLMHKVALVLFTVMPAFSFFNLWDSYLSFTLYSGNNSFATVYLSETVKNRLVIEGHRPYMLWDKENRVLINLHGWSFEEMNVPAYPEWRVYRNVARRLCAYADHPADVVLVVREKPGWLSGERAATSCDCSSLQGVEPKQAALRQ
jgi:hypothetical protein